MLIYKYLCSKLLWGAVFTFLSNKNNVAFMSLVCVKIGLKIYLTIPFCV